MAALPTFVLVVWCDDERVLPVKDDSQERSIPTVWRSTLAAIVDSLAAADGQPIGAGLADVEPTSDELSLACREAIRRYGDVNLVPLPQTTWDTSVCIWQGNRWQCLIDLWTAEEGRSDLALDVEVVEHGDGFRYSVILVYVP